MLLPVTCAREVAEFLAQWEDGLVGDFGCGNGKNLGPRAVGCDTSAALCALCRQGDVQVLRARGPMPRSHGLMNSYMGADDYR